MRHQVRLGYVGPRFAGTCDGPSAILVIVSGCHSSFVRKRFAFGRFDNRLKPLADILLVQDLAMRGVAKIKAFRCMLASESLRVAPHRYSHRLQRFSVPEIPA